MHLIDGPSRHVVKDGELVPDAQVAMEHVSPSERYRIVVSNFETQPGCWNYSQGKVYRSGCEEQIATVQRNHGSFPFLFVEGHPNGHDYLICGEDYHGQTVIELDTGKRVDLLPPEADAGHAFCWVQYEYAPVMQALIVDGCHWTGPHETRIYDFADPMNGWPQIGEDTWIDADKRPPEIGADGTVKVFQTDFYENDNDDALVERAPAASFKVYRREGLKLVEAESWISEKEQERRRRRDEATAE